MFYVFCVYTLKTGTFRCYLVACAFLKAKGWKKDLFAFKGELDKKKKEKYWLNLGSVPCKQAGRVFLIIIYIHSSAECTLCISYPRQSPSFCFAGFLVCISAIFTLNCGFDEALYQLKSPRVYTGQQMGSFYSYVALFHSAAWPAFVPRFASSTFTWVCRWAQSLAYLPLEKKPECARKAHAAGMHCFSLQMQTGDSACSHPMCARPDYHSWKRSNTLK